MDIDWYDGANKWGNVSIDQSNLLVPVLPFYSPHN